MLLTLGQRMTANFEAELNSIWANRLMTFMDEDEGWLAQVLLPRLTERVLLEWHAKQKRHRQLVTAELEQRQEVVRQKQVMLLMRKRENAPEGLARVFDDPLLAYHIIHDVAFSSSSTSAQLP